MTFQFYFKRVFFVVFVVLLAFKLQGQSLLYKISGEGMKNNVFIYGTIHALSQNDFFIDDIVLEKIDESEKIVLEIDMTDPNMIYEVQSSMIMKEKSIDALLSKDEFSRLKYFFLDSIQMQIDMVKHVKPLMLSSFLLPKIIGSQPASYEEFFLQIAIDKGIEIGGLETVSEQISFLDMIPLQEQAKMLMESVNDFNQSRIEFIRLVNVYKTRDIEKVYGLMMEMSTQYKDFGDYLIDARNLNWIPRIISLGNNKITFIAVGCGHLGGENGLINLFRKQGFSVQMLD
jgi:hypothetical protein